MPDAWCFFILEVKVEEVSYQRYMLVFITLLSRQAPPKVVLKIGAGSNSPSEASIDRYFVSRGDEETAPQNMVRTQSTNQETTRERKAGYSNASNCAARKYIPIKLV